MSHVTLDNGVGKVGDEYEPKVLENLMRERTGMINLSHKFANRAHGGAHTLDSPSMVDCGNGTWTSVEKPMLAMDEYSGRIMR